MLTQPLDDPAIIHVGCNTSALFCQNGHNSASEGWTFFPLAKCLFCILRRGPKATRSKIKFGCLGDPDMWHLADHQSSFFFGSKRPPTFNSENLKLLNCKIVLQRNCPNSANLWHARPAQQANLALVFSDHKPGKRKWHQENEKCKVHNQNKQDFSTLRCVTKLCHGSTNASAHSYFLQFML